MPPMWLTEHCNICKKPFSNEEDWDNRHSDFDGADIHSDCCDSQGPCSQVPFHPYPKEMN